MDTIVLVESLDSSITYLMLNFYLAQLRLLLLFGGLIIVLLNGWLLLFGFKLGTLKIEEDWEVNREFSQSIAFDDIHIVRKQVLFLGKHESVRDTIVLLIEVECALVLEDVCQVILDHVDLIGLVASPDDCVLDLLVIGGAEV